MPNGARHRLQGKLSKRRRGHLLTGESGEVWIVDFEDGIEIPQADRVIVEGVEIGPDRLHGDWVAAVS